MKAKNRFLNSTILVVCLSIMTVGCVTTDAQKGAGIGAVGGSLAGLAIGSLTGSAGAGAAIGAVAGTALGYVIGNEKDKEQAKLEAEREHAALEKSRVSLDPNTAYSAKKSNPLVGTTWRVVSLKSPKKYPAYSDMVVTFQTNTKVTTLTVLKDGKNTTKVEPYRVVDDILILTDSETNKMVNTKYSINGNRMNVNGEGWSVVLQKI